VNRADVIGGRYRLDRKIGEGGTGRIWLAQDGRLDRRVAIKFLFAQSPAQQARLARRVSLEAKLAASIQHRNVVQIFDFGTHEGDIPYIVMEALAGFTLAEAFDGAQSFSLDTLIYIMSEVLRGLSAVHDAGIVHRDLKPANIFLVKESRGKLAPKLLDFGISRSLEPELRSSAVTTMEGMILGTPQYMSPEQARGTKDIDKRTDIYSIGSILFEAFAGIVPFPARSTAELLIAVIQREAPPLYEFAPDIGNALCAVVDKALNKKPEQRYAHAADMLDALAAAAAEIPPELDRNAELFPPAGIRFRAPPPSDSYEEDAESAPMREATPETRIGLVSRLSRRASAPSGSDPATSFQTLVLDKPRSIPFKPTRAAWLALSGLALFALTIAAAAVLIDRSREPDGSGMIVVQAPGPNLAATQPTSPPAAAPPPRAAEPAEPVALDERPEPRPKRAAAAKARKAEPSDPLQLMAARVAEAFAKQKAGVVACLNSHAVDLEGAAQLQMRLVIARNGVASDATLLPDSIAGKPVAVCMKGAVAKMSFPPQEQPTTFRIPLSWRRK
jgi:serine/threonine protein kinase